MWPHNDDSTKTVIPPLSKYHYAWVERWAADFRDPKSTNKTRIPSSYVNLPIPLPMPSCTESDSCISPCPQCLFVSPFALLFSHKDNRAMLQVLVMMTSKLRVWWGLDLFPLHLLIPSLFFVSMEMCVLEVLNGKLPPRRNLVQLSLLSTWVLCCLNHVILTHDRHCNCSSMWPQTKS